MRNRILLARRTDGLWALARIGAVACCHLFIPALVSAMPDPLAWTESFIDDPIAGARFHVPVGHDAGRFTYDAVLQRLVAHYNTNEPTAWYARTLDPARGGTLTDCEGFRFEVTFHIRSENFYADPFQFAQIAWGLVHSTRTGLDRAGGSAGPYSFDLVTFDYFPNVGPFGGPTLAGTTIHSNLGQGFFNAIEFPFGAESQIDTAFGDETIQLDTTYTARLDYDSATRVLTLTLRTDIADLHINTDGAGGPGGPDADTTTIQTYLYLPDPFEVDTFALTAWHDSFNPAGDSVIADVEIHEISFAAPGWRHGDMNRDGNVNGLDIQRFVDTLVTESPAACDVRRADFTGDATVSLDDLVGFEEALLEP